MADRRPQWLSPANCITCIKSEGRSAQARRGDDRARQGGTAPARSFFDQLASCADAPLSPLPAGPLMCAELAPRATPPRSARIAIGETSRPYPAEHGPIHQSTKTTLWYLRQLRPARFHGDARGHYLFPLPGRRVHVTRLVASIDVPQVPRQSLRVVRLMSRRGLGSHAPRRHPHGGFTRVGEPSANATDSATILCLLPSPSAFAGPTFPDQVKPEPIKKPPRGGLVDATCSVMRSLRRL